MKKMLLLLTTLTCMSLSAGPFEDICQKEGVTDAQLQALANAKACVSVDLRHAQGLMRGLNPLLAELIAVADESNLEHENILRRLVNEYARRLSHVAKVPRALSDFGFGTLSYTDFLRIAKSDIDGVVSKEILVRNNWPPRNLITVRRLVE